MNRDEGMRAAQLGVGNAPEPSPSMGQAIGGAAKAVGQAVAKVAYSPEMSAMARGGAEDLFNELWGTGLSREPGAPGTPTQTKVNIDKGIVSRDR